MRPSLVGLLLVVLLLPSSEIPLLQQPVLFSTSYVAHEPIRITRDSEFTLENGVTQGQGTGADPYVIEGWSINASDNRWNLGETVFLDNNQNNKYNVGTDQIILRGTDVVKDGIILADDPKVRHVDSNNNGIWNQGETIVYDKNGNGSFDTGEPVITGTSPSPNALLDDDPKVKVTGAVTGVFIINTKAYFVVRNVKVFDGILAGGPAGPLVLDVHGVSLVNVSNGRIEDSLITNNDFGLALQSSSNNTVTRVSSIANREYGIYVSGGGDNVVSSNDLSDNQDGVSITSSRNNLVENNQVSGSSERRRYGFWLSSRATANTIRNNTVVGGSISFLLNGQANANLLQWNNSTMSRRFGIEWFGIDISGCTNNVVEYNVASGAHVAMVLTSSNSTLIRGNYLYNSDYGIGIEVNNWNNTITGNIAIQDNQAFYITRSGPNLVFNNVFQGIFSDVYEDSREPVIFGQAPADRTILKDDPKVRYADFDNNGVRTREFSAEPVAYDSNSNGEFEGGGEIIVSGSTTLPTRDDSKLVYIDVNSSFAREVGEPTFHDTNGNGFYDPAEPVIAGPSPVEGSSGTDDPKLKYVDPDNNAVWDIGETVWYDTDGDGAVDFNNGEPILNLKDDPLIRYVDSNSNDLRDEAETVTYDSNNNNMFDANFSVWGIPATPGPNILGGPFLGGNYYARYNGADLDQDGMGDSPYFIPPSQALDSLPLMATAEGYALDWADYDNNGQITITDLSELALLYEQSSSYWDLDRSGVVGDSDVSRAAGVFDRQLSAPYSGQRWPQGRMDPVWKVLCQRLPQPERDHCLAQ